MDSLGYLVASISGFYLPIPVILEAKKGAAAIRAFAHEEVSKKGQRHGKVRYINMLTSFPSPRHQRCLLTRELVDQIMTFLAAGHETTASALTWAVYQMCTYPELQECLRKEICTKLPSIRDIDSKVTSLEVDRQASIPQRRVQRGSTPHSIRAYHHPRC